jgi:hypothetical protein
MYRTEQINSACVMHDTRTHTEAMIMINEDGPNMPLTMCQHLTMFDLSFFFFSLFICPNHIDKLRRQIENKYHRFFYFIEKCICEYYEIFKSVYILHYHLIKCKQCQCHSWFFVFLACRFKNI